MTDGQESHELRPAALFALLAYASQPSHAHSRGWVAALQRILSRLEVTCG